MQLNVCTKSSSGGSRPRPCCPQRKLPPCCSGLCWPLVRSRCAKWTAGEASTIRHPIRRLISPHNQVTSSCWRSHQNQFQHKLRRHPTVGSPIGHRGQKLYKPQDGGPLIVLVRPAKIFVQSDSSRGCCLLPPDRCQLSS